MTKRLRISAFEQDKITSNQEHYRDLFNVSERAQDCFCIIIFKKKTDSGKVWWRPSLKRFWMAVRLRRGKSFSSRNKAYRESRKKRNAAKAAVCPNMSYREQIIVKFSKRRQLQKSRQLCCRSRVGLTALLQLYYAVTEPVFIWFFFKKQWTLARDIGWVLTIANELSKAHYSKPVRRALATNELRLVTNEVLLLCGTYTVKPLKRKKRGNVTQKMFVTRNFDWDAADILTR